MAGKRTATSDLNHDNWDRDDEPEDAGTFQRAPEDIIKGRIIKTARRRNPISSVHASNSEEGEKKGVFAGFTAFAKAPPPTTTAFGFLSNLINKPEQTKTNGTADKKEEIPTFAFNKAENNSPMFNVGTSKNSSEKSSEYYGKLKGLNESVAKWIKKHVDSNPLINLQPVFKDYEKYFEELEKEDKASSASKSNTVAKADESKTGSSSKSFFAKADVPNSSAEKKASSSVPENKLEDKWTKLSFEAASTVVTTESTFGFSNANASPFSFGSLKNAPPDSNPKNLFGSSSSGSGFSFSSTTSTPYSFGNVSKPVTKDAPNKDTAEEEDEPPKVEFTPVVEEGHIYTTRCKVFVKKDGTFGDRGVGNLYLKPVEKSEKVQLIVRADTNLGNLLCNFILSESIPMQRLGKKDVMLVCLPTPDTNPPPVSVLFRVKSSEAADTLLETLQKHKK